MDNVSIFSVQINKAPTSNNREAYIIEWLSSNDIPHNPSQTRVELLLHKSAHCTYEIDEIARQRGHRSDEKEGQMGLQPWGPRVLKGPKEKNTAS